MTDASRAATARAADLDPSYDRNRVTVLVRSNHIDRGQPNREKQ